MTLPVDTIRYVLFDGATSPRNALELWQAATGGGMPEGFQQGAFPGAPAVANGRLGKYRATLATQPGRIELAIAELVVPDAADPTAPVAHITDAQAAMARGLSATRKLLSNIDLNRLAIVVDSSESFSDSESAVARMLRDLSFLNPPTGTIDLTYHVNNRVFSRSVPSIQINRLCRWATASRQVLQFEIGGGGSSAPRSHVVSSVPVYTVAYDVNTVAFDVRLTQAQRKALLDDVSEQVGQLLARGYEFLG